MNHHLLRARLGRKVALVAHANNFLVEAESEQDFRGGRQKRDNAHSEPILGEPRLRAASAARAFFGSPFFCPFNKELVEFVWCRDSLMNEQCIHGLDGSLAGLVPRSQSYGLFV